MDKPETEHFPVDVPTEDPYVTIEKLQKQNAELAKALTNELRRSEAFKQALRYLTQAL